MAKNAYGTVKIRKGASKCAKLLVPAERGEGPRDQDAEEAGGAAEQQEVLLLLLQLQLVRVHPVPVPRHQVHQRGHADRQGEQG